VQYWAGECQSGTCARPAVLHKVIWAGSQFVAVGTERVSTTAGPVEYGLILTSSDGVSWTQRARDSLPAGYTGGYPPAMADVAWSGTMLVAVGTAPSSQSPAAWTSPDGITWTFRPISTGYTMLRSVTWGRGYFVAGGLGFGSYRSPDGVTWQEGTTPVSPVSALTASSSRYLALRRPISPMSSIDGLVWTDISAYPNCWGEVIWDRTRYVAMGDGGKVCVSP
jgi:hypothetical protein